MGTTPPITTNNPHNTRSTKPDPANTIINLANGNKSLFGYLSNLEPE